MQKALERLSPFELKDRLISLALGHSRRSAAQMLNAGRGNPNWIATTPRSAFFLLGQFAIEESKRVWNAPDRGGMPEEKGIARRLQGFLIKNKKALGARLLRDCVDYGCRKLGFDPDLWVHELADGVIGDQYPVPVRMLKFVERIVHDYLCQEMCGGKPPRGRYDLFAVEGGTAGICYILDSLLLNNILHRGDAVALALPTFTPYTEIPRLVRYRFKVVRINASERAEDGTPTWQYPDSEIDKLADRSIKAFFVVNPSNPPSVAMRPSTVRRLVQLVKTRHPDLMIVTDDVYATFVNGFRSLMVELPQNTIGVYSYSKYFGATGWRLGLVAVHERNIFDRMFAELPVAQRRALNRRYSSISLRPEKLKFIDRMVADSRQVALNHTAGLSLPQQVQMALFSAFALVDKENTYKQLTQSIVQRRLKALWGGMELPLPDDELRAGYYTEVDLKAWALNQYGAGFVKFLIRNYEPLDILFRLAEQASIVLLNGGGFEAPKWSLRVSLANLPEEAYAKIGEYLRRAVRGYVEEWKRSLP